MPNLVSLIKWSNLLFCSPLQAKQKPTFQVTPKSHSKTTPNTLLGQNIPWHPFGILPWSLLPLVLLQFLGQLIHWTSFGYLQWHQCILQLSLLPLMWLQNSQYYVNASLSLYIINFFMKHCSFYCLYFIIISKLCLAFSNTISKIWEIQYFLSFFKQYCFLL